MRVALVHDYIKEYGGAERVLEALHEIWPDAPVYTTVNLPEFLGPHIKRFDGWDIRTSWLQGIPFRHKLISPFRILMPFVFGQFDFSDFDVVIVSATGAYFPNLLNKKKAVQICYCHTPPRYLYGYATAREWKKNIVFRILGEIANHFLRIADFNSSKNVDYYIANSQEVAARIKKFYKREAVVVYPPIDTTGSIKGKEKGKYYLAGGRLARPKHIDLIIKACRDLNVPLKVFGKGFAGYEKEIKGSEFVGEVSDEEKWKLMRNAKAYINASEDEDFGITPVEAMSAGTPVIAYKSGGVVESVVEGKTGIFFEELSVESLKKAMKQFNNAIIDPNDCVKQAQRFSKERFKSEIQLFISRVVKA
ncbi:MAG: glycosyltransferase [Candidatus Levybacteria bacterium]|nr:glycosyltransferase [Candidatus Levybacteria bacterium]